MKNKKKWLISFLLVLIIIWGSLSAVIADSSITGLLSSWLTEKTDQAINEIDVEIQEEQAVQTERLKAELDKSINRLESEINTFIQVEKEKRISALQGYADELIAAFGVDEADRKAEIERELERIFEEAIKEIDQLKINKQTQTEEEHEDAKQ